LAREGLVRTASDPDGFEGAVREALHEPPSARAARSRRAAAHGWEARMEALAERVAKALGPCKPASFQEESRRL
ncbi:MAG: hypothetical protein R3263_12840, partial [Myxococcota bacterium]|nr:hypothetical protein [Myxococcota bacterium]